MSKIKKIEKSIANMRKELIKLAQTDTRVMEIVRELDAFRFTQTKRGIDIWYERGVIPMMGIFKEDDMCYALELMNFLIRIYYKCKKVISIINQKDAEVVIDAILEDFARAIRKQCLEDIKENENFKNLEFYEEFKEIVGLAKKALHHKIDKIGKLTYDVIPEESEELSAIRKIYEQINFQDHSISYFDYIENDQKIVKIDNIVEIQYMLMVTYMKAYTETLLWLLERNLSDRCCPYTPWQVLMKLEKIIYKYFLEIAE